MRTKNFIGKICIVFLFTFFFALVKPLFSQKQSTISSFLLKSFTGANIKIPNDTLLPGNLPNVTNPEYVILTDEHGGFILGTNQWNDKCKCQQYKVTFPYHIEGAIFWFGYKRTDSTGLIKFTVWDMKGTDGTTSAGTGQPCPGTPLLSSVDSMINIDTSSFLNQAHIVMFSEPLFVDADYCIGFDMSLMQNDTVALVSTNKGQGGGLELVWEQWSSNNKWYTLQGAQWDGGSVDVDAMILPIIDNTVGCDEAQQFISGMKISQVYPNPTKNEISVKCEFVQTFNTASFEIFNLKGQRIFCTYDIPTTKGTHVITIDVSSFSDGTYIYVLSTPSGRIAKKMTISR